MRKIFIDEREIIFKKNKKLEKEYKKRKNKNQRKPWSFTGILFKTQNNKRKFKLLYKFQYIFTKNLEEFQCEIERLLFYKQIS